MQTAEEKTILTPIEERICRRYELGTIERNYRYQGCDLRQEKEGIPVFIEYRLETPARDSHGNCEGFDCESITFDSDGTHRPFFSEGYSGLTNQSGQRIYGGHFVKTTDRRDGEVIRSHVRGFQPTAKHPLDISTWERDIVALFEKLPKEVRDVVGL